MSKSKLGHLFTVKFWHQDYPVMEMLTLGPVERSEAELIAIKELQDDRQVIFMDRDGKLELWYVHELRNRFKSIA
jgi:hypothetical protein